MSSLLKNLRASSWPQIVGVSLLFVALIAGTQFARKPLPLPEGWHHGAFMEIFVRSYKDSNGDGIGDLKGLIQSLDHLKELGIKGIWLMPITTSADKDHGYATTNFRNIDPDYGTLADFDELILQAHARGIGVIMDYVLNHSAKEHPYFEESLKNPQSPYRDWFEWRREKPQGRPPRRPKQAGAPPPAHAHTPPPARTTGTATFLHIHFSVRVSCLA
jgi:glycosidase